MSLLVQKTVAQSRYDICKECPRLTALKLCNICNCIMPVKVKFALAVCPAGKWKSVTDHDKVQTDAYEDLT